MKYEITSGHFSAEVEAASEYEAYRVAIRTCKLPDIFGELIACRSKGTRRVVYLWTPHLFNELGIKFEQGPRKHQLRILECPSLEVVEHG